MIKILLKRIFLFLIICCNLYSGQLLIQPEKAIENQEVHFQYKPENKYDLAEVKLILYLFKTGFIEPEAIELKLIKQDSIYSNKFMIDGNIAYALIKVLAGESYDNNLQEFWDLVVYDEKGFMPKKDAFYFKAYSYLGSLPENCQRLTSYSKAVEYFEEELKFYPNNNTAILSLLLLKYDRKRISENEFKALITKIYDKEKENLDESSTILMIRALRLIKENNKAEIIENSYIIKNPSSKLAQEKELSQLSRITNYREFNQRAFEFLKKYQNSHLSEKIWVALIQSFSQNYNLHQLVDRVFEYEYVPSSIYIRLAFNLLKNDIIYSDDELDIIINRLTKEALTKLTDDINYQKPSYYSLSEWEKIIRVNQSKIYQEWGDLLSLLNKDDEAMEKYLTAIEFLKTDYPVSLTESTILQASKLNQDSLALQIATQAILDSKTTNFIDSVFKNLQQKLSEGNQNIILDSLKKIAEEKRRSRIKQNLIKVTSDISLQTTGNTIINLNNYKGNILILVLWAKWCDPCLDLLSFLEKYDRNSMINQNVIMFPVNSLDTDIKSTTNFLKQNKISLNYYIDINDEISTSFGLNGLPATVFIDKIGQIRYIEKGFSDKNSYEQLFNDLIKILN